MFVMQCVELCEAPLGPVISIVCLVIGLLVSSQFSVYLMTQSLESHNLVVDLMLLTASMQPSTRDTGVSNPTIPQELQWCSWQWLRPMRL